MKTMKNWLFSGLLFLMVSTVFSQGKITGTVTDGQGSLPGANIAVKGSKIGVSADFDGKFSISTPADSGELVISFIGFEPKTVKFSVGAGATKNLGTIVLVENSNQLNEIVVKSSVIDIAKDRKTPVAVSTIKAAEIQEKLGTQEFPEILANTPSVYATKSGGGFGDSRINIRGFDQKNVAVMINGMPVNDMENSAVYWSNWAGLSDVTSAMQVQRGLGSSKLAISSVGGTINIVTKTSDMKEGGSVSTGFGNADYLKTVASYSTGKLQNGLSASVLIGQTFGDGYVDGTKFQGYNYFVGLGYSTKNDKHDFQFTFTGAPQWHNQRSNAPTIATYLKYGSNGEPNIKYNSDWGYLNGQEFNFRKNYFHKPVASVNWDFKINETTKLSSVFYGSWGRGGGTNGAGAIRGNRFFADALKTADGLINVDLIQAYNSGLPVVINGATVTRTKTSGVYQSNSLTSNTTSNGITQISSVNSHDWYGGVINLNKKLSNKLILDFGVDARAYRGIHYNNLINLLGSQNYLDNNDINNVNTLGVKVPRILTNTYSSQPSANPFLNLDNQEKINFNNDGLVRWYGAFTQLEYSNDNLTAFVQGAVSQQGFRRDDYFKYKTTDPLYSTDYENILGGNVKGGANYNINENHNVFVNAGYYSKQPFFNAVYPNNSSVVGANLTNEKVTGLEAGYGFRSRSFNANLNVYHTTWKDRYERRTDISVDNPGGYFDFSGITQIHSGVELEANARITDKFKANTMFSVGKWVYDGNSLSNRYDATNNPIGGGTPSTLYLDGVRVGDAAQMTASIGASYEVLERVTLDANYRYSDKLFASISPNSFTTATHKGTLELPSYGLMDAGFSYKMLVGRNKANSLNFRLNVNNVLDKTYIAESKTNIFADDNVSSNAALGTYASNNRLYNGVADGNTVFFGFGRTWNFSLRYNF
jgi:hypothetical protein